MSKFASLADYAAKLPNVIAAIASDEGVFVAYAKACSGLYISGISHAVVTSKKALAAIANAASVKPEIVNGRAVVAEMAAWGVA